MIAPWHVVAIAETVRRAMAKDRPLLMIADPCVCASMAVRRLCGDLAMRAPHSSCSTVQLADEAAKAAGGVLFLDDVSDFRRPGLRTLTQWRANTSIVAIIVPPTRDSSEVVWRYWSARVARIAGDLGADVVDMHGGCYEHHGAAI